MSDTAKKIAGTYIADSQEQRPPLGAWLQEQLRSGELHEYLLRFVEAQPEILDPKLVMVQGATPDWIYCQIPCMVCDHESKHPMPFSVEFDLNPLTGVALRRT